MVRHRIGNVRNEIVPWPTVARSPGSNQYRELFKLVAGYL